MLRNERKKCIPIRLTFLNQECKAYQFINDWKVQIYDEKKGNKEKIFARMILNITPKQKLSLQNKLFVFEHDFKT